MKVLQEIILNKDVFERISASFEDPDQPIDLRSFRENIKNNRIVFDDPVSNLHYSLYEEIVSYIKSQPDIIKKHLTSILNDFLFAERSRFIKSDEFQKITNNSSYNVLLNLAHLSNDQILASQDKTAFIFKKDRLEELEIVDVQEYCNPPTKSKLFSRNRELELKEKEYFSFKKYLSYYFKNAKCISIHDNYIRNKKSLILLKEILSLSKNLESIKIFTALSDLDQVGDRYISKEELRSEIKTGTKLEPTIENTLRNEHDRHIYTDEYDIFLSSGLDFVNKRNEVWRDKVKILIKPLNNNSVLSDPTSP